MSYKIKLGTIKKYVESTARPNTNGWAEYDVVFKDGTDVVNPTITLSIEYGAVKDYNYAVMLDRYYWITSKTMARTNLCIIQLETDVLATYKDDIGDTNLYILRSSAASDGSIIDNYYPIKGGATHYGVVQQPFYSNGFYVVNIMGTETTGTTTLWRMSAARFRAFIGNLYLNINGYQFSDATDALAKLVGGQPEQLVSSAMWFPNGVNFSVDEETDVYVGGWYSGVKANLLNHSTTGKIVKFTIPHHPLAATRGSYLNLSPYSIYTLTIPMFGSINIDSTLLIGATEIDVDLGIDAISGGAVAQITTDASTSVLAQLSGQIGVILPLKGQSAGGNIASGLVRTAAATAGAIASHGATAIAGAVSSGIGTIIGSITGSTSSASSSGNAYTSAQVWKLNSVHYDITNEDNTHYGRPYCTMNKPKNLGGYMIVSRGDVDINGTLPEEEKIRSFLENGFYYE